MSLFAAVRSVVTRFVRRSQIAEDLEEELRSHIEHRADDLEQTGMIRTEAERQARIEFGAHERIREETLEAISGNLLYGLWHDVKYALRVLGKAKGFAVAAIGTLALAIGANAVIFGVTDALMLRTLNVPHAKNLYGMQYAADSQFQSFQSYPNYLDLRDRNKSFEDLAAFNITPGTAIDTGKDPQAATGFATTGNYFTVLGVHPFLGRLYTSADEQGLGSAPFLVLSYGYWHSRFGDNRGVIGRVVSVNKHPFTIIGVTPPEFGGTVRFVSPDFYLPIVEQEVIGGNSMIDRTSWTVLETVGHLKPGVTPAQAEADVNAVASYLAKTYPKEVEAQHIVIGRTGLSAFTRPVHRFVAALTVMAVLILLGACANLGGLFAAHTGDRAKEVALRLALGSTRRRILRQLMTEATMLALAGGTLGVLVGMPLLERLSTWHPFPGAPLHIPVTADARIYLAALVLALVSGILFGIVPVRQVMRANPYEVVKATATGAAARAVTVRDVLLVVPIAICAVLVTSSLVAVRGLVWSVNASFGFDPVNTMLAAVNLTSAGYKSGQIPQFNRKAIEALAGIPGVKAVGSVNDYPPLVFGAAREKVFSEEIRDMKPANVALTPYRFNVSPGYLKAAGTVLLAGRDFTWDDNRSKPVPAVANREFAKRMFGSEGGAIARHFRIGDGTLVEIVGIMQDGKYHSLTEDEEPAIFLPSTLYWEPQSYFVVRSQRDPQQLAALMRAKLRELDDGLVVDIESYTQLLELVQFPAKVTTIALGVLGMIGATLSVTGIFGMAAYSVSHRMKELGIRLALGAGRTAVLRTVLGRAVWVLAAGSGVGMALGILAGRGLSNIVYQATSRDPVVLAGVVVAMALLGLVATWIPAQRALSLDPLLLLRDE